MEVIIIFGLLAGIAFFLQIFWPIIEGIFKSLGELIGVLFKVALIGGAILLIMKMMSG